jgi:hypothetical protein
VSAVESAVRSAVVRIGAPGDGYNGEDGGPRAEFWGSGFFIAPGWVLTISHVVAKGRGAVWRGDRVIGITTESGEKLVAELACALPRPSAGDQRSGPWADPDLALLRVPEEPAASPPNALWLSDRSALNSAHVELYGYSAALGADVAYVQGSGRASAGAGGPMMLEGTYVPAGCSGGPVVDRDRGSVIGVNKGRARDGSHVVRATPITALRRFCEEGAREAAAWREALRAHDRHHLERFLALDWSWPREQFLREQQRDPGGYASGFTAYDRAELFGRFAELPPPVSAGEVLEMVEEARRDVRRETFRLHIHSPRSWREGVGLLYDMHDGSASGGESSRDRERAAVVLYAARVCQALSAPGRTVPLPRTATSDEKTTQQADPLAELRTWVGNAAVTLPNGIDRELVQSILDSAAAGPGPRTSHADVLVEIDPDLYGTHPWRIKLVQEDGRVTPVRQNETGVPRAELERDIRAALADALDKGDIGEHLAAVDFMLPRGMFDEPVEMWRAREASPDEPFSPHTLPLGHRRTVALRDRHRWMQRERIPEWHQRWRVIKKGHMQAVPLCLGSGDGGDGGLHHTHPESELAAYGRLRSAEPHAVPVHCTRAGSGQGAVALGVALGAGHPVVLWRRCDEQHSDCAEFHERAAELLNSARSAGAPESLRELVRDLRNQNAGPDVSKPATAWAGDLVLLYDPPQGPQLADEPLRAPPLRP